jgi:long-chain acyl-CoA synthetase
MFETLSSKSYVVAVVCPVPATLAELAGKFGKGDLEFEELCRDRDVTGAVLREVTNHAKNQRLEKFEVPGAVTLTSVEWTPDTGLTTAAMKLKRKPLQEFYKADLARMYGD